MELGTCVHVAKESNPDEGAADYPVLRALMAERAMRNTGPVYTTDVSPENIDVAWRYGIRASSRQYYNCRACVEFIRKFGGLVTINDVGDKTPVLWAIDPPRFFAPSVASICRVIEPAKVNGVFYDDAQVWGTPQTGAWTHLYAYAPVGAYHGASSVLTAAQRMAEKEQEFGMLRGALQEFSRETARAAVELIGTETLYLGERVHGVAEWFAAVKEQEHIHRGFRGHNLLWAAVADAPPGYAHVRTGMIGTLLADIQAGMPAPLVRQRFAKKMEGYMRPTAPPAAGAITSAEQLVEKLGAKSALHRRYAKLSDVQAFWTPTPVPEQPKPAAGLFGHLRSVHQPDRATALLRTAPPITMTWEKFKRTVLPTARELSVFIDNGLGPFGAMVTAVVEDAPNILQWDNPVSWYVYKKLSYGARWNLLPGNWHPVTALSYSPAHWGLKDMGHQSPHVWVLIRGARDTDYRGGGLMFPANLRAEFHPIRSVIEAYSQEGRIVGELAAEACGLMMSRDAAWGIRLRVNSGQVYHLDRAD